MPYFPIAENLEEALKRARTSRRDDLGYLYYTFRIRLLATNTNWQTVLSRLVDEGWQLQAAPVMIEATDAHPQHILISMLHAEPRPMEIKGELRIRGEIVGGGDLRGTTRGTN